MHEWGSFRARALRKPVCTALVTLSLVLPLHAGPFDAWNRKLTIAYTNYEGAATLTNFPVLVKLSTDVAGFYYEDFSSPTGGDLRFADGVSSNELNYEVDEWHPDGTSYVWVQIPAFTNGTVIHAHWRNPSQITAPGYTTNGSTWANGHVGVWHMKEPENAPADSALQPADNSGSNAHLGSFALVDAKIGTGYDYVDTGRIDLGNKADLADLQQATVMCWYYKRSRGGGDWGTFFGRSDNNGGLRHAGTDMLRMRSGGNYPISSGVLADGAWHFVAFTFENAGDVAETFVNGISVSNVTTTVNWFNPDYIIGSGNLSDRAIDGIADELRASNVVRPADWIRATYMTTASNATFATYGTVEELDRDPNQPVIHTLEASDVMTTSATLNGDLASTGAAPVTVRVYLGPEDMGTNAALWAQEVQFLEPPPVGPLATNITGLTSGAVYHYRYFAENVHGGAWSRTSKSFATDGPPLVDNTGETPEVGFAFLNGTVMTNGAETHGTVYWGPTDGGPAASAWANTSVLSGPVTGAFYADTRHRVAWETGMTGRDINNPGLAGSSSEAGGVWTVTGSGTDIYGTADEFQFASRPADGDFDVHCRVGLYSGGDNLNRKAGIMLRQSFAGNSRHVSVVRTPTNGSNRIVMMRRMYEGGGTATEGPSGITNEFYWIRLAREEDTFTGYWAEDNAGSPAAWQKIGATRTVSIAREAHLGLAVCAHNRGQLTTVEFDGFSGDVPGVGELVYGAPYYYRCYATNAFGGRWAEETEMFVTAPPPGVGIVNETPSDVAVDSVMLNGLLNATGSVFDVSLLWGATDEGTDTGAWANTNVVGSYSNLNAVGLSSVAPGLAQGTWYGTFIASNAATNRVAAPSERFQPMGGPVVSNWPPQDVTDSSATLNGYLAAGGAGAATVYWGLTDAENDLNAWAGTNAAGSIVALRTIPAPANGLMANGPYYSRWYVTNAVGTDWADSSLVFTTAPPAVTIGDVALREGDDGSAVAHFPVTLSTPSAIPVSLDFSTSNGAAEAGSDYVSTNGTLTIGAGQASSGIDVRLAGDKQIEALYEGFFLNTENPADCTLVNARAVCTIEDDDLGTIVSAWSYRMKITLSGYTGSETLTDFAALVKFDDTLTGFSYGQFASTTGEDLRFTDATSTQILNHEIETWDRNGISYVWVRVPQLSGNRTTIWAYWGNPEAAAPAAAETSATWGEEYLGVYHLHAAATDSTTNANHGVDTGGPLRLPGIAGNGIDVTGGAHVNLQGGDRWDRLDTAHEDAFTLSAWVNPDTLAVDQSVFGRFGNHSLVWLDAGGGLENYVIYSVGGQTRTSETAGAPATQDAWQYVVATGDGVALRIYVDGQLGSAAGGNYDYTPSTVAISLGTTQGGSNARALDGSLDEARIAATARSVDWILAEYKNVAEHAGFVHYGAAEALKPGTLLLVR